MVEVVGLGQFDEFLTGRAVVKQAWYKFINETPL